MKVTELARRETSGGISGEPLVILDAANRFVLADGKTIYLNPMEFSLMMAFVNHSNMVLTRLQLFHEVWGADFLGATRTVDMHVSALRKKLGWKNRLQTVRRAGYRFLMP